MKQPREQQNRFAFVLHSRMGSRWTLRPSSIFYFNWLRHSIQEKEVFMRNHKSSVLFIAVVIAMSVPIIAEDKPAAPDSASPVATTPVATPQTNLATPSTFDQVVDRVVGRERAFNEQMRAVQPLVETYIQTLSPDHELGHV